MLPAVQYTGQIPDQEHAREAAQATLKVLGQRLTGGETHDRGPAAAAVPVTGTALIRSARGPAGRLTAWGLHRLRRGAARRGR